MIPADLYRVKAGKLAKLAEKTQTPRLRIEYATMAVAYLRLAELAERNIKTDGESELPR